MHKKYINRKWRNWNDENKQDSKGIGAKKPIPIPVPIPVKVVKPSSIYKNNKKFNFKATLAKTSNLSSKLAMSNFDDWSEVDDRLGDYENDMCMARHANTHVLQAEEVQKRINLGKAKSAFELEEGLKVRRLSTVLSNVISKLAEDQNCEPIPGDDEWNVDDLMMRKITKRPINSCKQSRDRSNIVLMLDSSPSCEEQAAFYSSIAIGAVGLNVLDVYDAPNCKVVRKFNYKIKRFQEFLSREEIQAGITGWDYINNRTILFFGDYDGIEEVCRESKSNKIYWFNPDYREHGINQIMENKDFAGKVFECRNTEDFIKLIRKLK